MADKSVFFDWVKEIANVYGDSKGIPISDLVYVLEELGNNWNWAKNPNCKYLTIDVDTRTGFGTIRDRNGNLITVHNILQQYGDFPE